MEQQDLVAAIKSDHRAVLAVFDELESGSGDAQRRRDLADHAITELVRHSVGEEQYLYPVARKSLPGAEEMVRRDLEEHAGAERLMKQLEGLDPTGPEFEELLETLMTDIRGHVEEEEADLLPRLQAHCDGDDLRELGEKFSRAKQLAPTRPHPLAPDTPPANKILAPGAGMVDRLRDALDRNAKTTA